MNMMSLKTLRLETYPLKLYQPEDNSRHSGRYSILVKTVTTFGTNRFFNIATLARFASLSYFIPGDKIAPIKYKRGFSASLPL